MSSVLIGTISGMRVIQEMMNNTVNNIKDANNNSSEKIVVENSVDDSNLNQSIYTTNVHDEYNDFLDTEILNTNAQIEEEKATIEQFSKLTNLLCDKSQIFNTGINDIYNAIHEEIIVKDQNIINDKISSQLKNIIVSLKDFDEKLDVLEEQIKIAIENKINEANILLDNIHKLNIISENLDYSNDSKEKSRIKHEQTVAINALNNLINIKVEKKDNKYKIYLNNGTCLLDSINYQIKHLIPITSSMNPTMITVGYQDENIPNQINRTEDKISSGSLGALLKFRRKELNDTRNKIGQITLNFIDSMNTYHTMGYDQYGQVGEQIFSISDPLVQYHTLNKLYTKIYASWDHPSEAKSSDYKLLFKNNQWIVTRLADNQIVTPNLLKKMHGKPFLNFSVDGITVNIANEAQDGDSFIIKPYFNLLKNLQLFVSDNTPFAASLNSNPSQLDKNTAVIMHQFYTDKLVDHSETFNDAFLNFAQNIMNDCHLMEKDLPLKEATVDFLNNKKKLSLQNIDTEYENLNYEQKSYLANAKIVQTAEKIFEEIISAYNTI